MPGTVFTILTPPSEIDNATTAQALAKSLREWKKLYDRLEDVHQLLGTENDDDMLARKRDTGAQYLELLKRNECSKSPII